MIGSDLCAGQVRAAGGAAGDCATVNVGVRSFTLHRTIGKERSEVFLAGDGIAWRAFAARPTMARHFGRIDAGQADSRRSAANRVAVDNVRGGALKSRGFRGGRLPTDRLGDDDAAEDQPEHSEFDDPSVAAPGAASRPLRGTIDRLMPRRLAVRRSSSELVNFPHRAGYPIGQCPTQARRDAKMIMDRDLIVALRTVR